MKVYDAAALRNVAIVGHSGAGKTQLASAMLFDAGMVNRLGLVDEGTTVTDYDEEAIARKHTLGASVAFAEWDRHKINLVDTPGIANFLSDARAALRVVDLAVVVVDAVAGVEVSTEKVWAAADELELPRLVVLNRLDRERASLARALDSLRGAFGRTVVPIQWPIGEEKAFQGVLDLVTMTAFRFAADGTGRSETAEIPADLVEPAQAARAALVEMVAEADDALMERFFEAGTLADAELISGLRRAVHARKIFPVLCTSALANIGVGLLADAIVQYGPSPADRPIRARQRSTGEEVTLEPTDTGPCSLFVWKTMADPFAGRITLFRVLRGLVKADSTVYNLTRDVAERFGHVFLLQGKQQVPVSEVRAGDLGAVAKLKDTLTGDTLADKGSDVSLSPIAFPDPVLSYAIEPKTRGDEDKISMALARLREEDPAIAYGRDAQTKELLLSGQGQMHIEVTVAKLKRRFGVDVHLKLPRVPYRETITAATEAHGRHKKQTGGHGQFGDCKIRVEPLPRGADFEFVDDIFGGAIPRQFIPAVEKGIQEARMKGYLAGYPVVDFKVTVFDGQFHPVDSNELSFKLAGSLAFKDAMSRAKPTLLEPVMDVEVYAPSECAGDVMGDLNGRRGRISGMETRGQTTVIRAQVPMAEMLTYEQTLTSVTGGRGTYSMEFSHYEEVPAHLQAKIIQAARAAKGEEAEAQA